MLKIKLAIPLSLMILVLSGCTLSLGQKEVDNTINGGVFKSIDHGLTWIQKTAVPSTNGQALSIAGLEIYTMTMDPSDNNAIYLGMAEKGLIYSYNAGESWTPIKSKTMSSVNISDYAIDPKNKCIMYASVSSNLMKTIDCGRTWQVAYTDAKARAVIYAIAIDHYDPTRLYLGSADGNLFMSSDSGFSWQNIKIFSNKSIKRIVLNNIDSRIILVGMADGNLQRSLDGGLTWLDLGPKFKQFKGSKVLRDLIAVPSRPNTFLLAIKYGLLKTVNNGDDWTEIKLLTPKQPVTINSLAVSYKNPSLIYYVTDQTFYRTQDGGENWTTTPAPTTRQAWKILTDPLQDGLVYLAVRK